MIEALTALVLGLAQAEATVGSQSSLQARQTMQSLGHCFAIEHPLQTRTLLAKDFREKSYGRDMRSVLRRPANCGAYKFPRDGFGAVSSGTLLWGGALAEGLLKRDGAIAQLRARTAHDPSRPEIEARNAGEFMAFCLVRKDPAAAARLLETRAATVEEFEAIRGLSVTLPGCVPQGSQSKFSREALRALIATGAYRLAMHNQEQSQ
jgi:hypothetical protein